uniref:ATP-dependent DNA helicase n=4 Tax=Meloidogyne TaxID=189290 RepID=A0A914N5S4_MELIC
MPSRQQNNRRKRKLSYLAEGTFGSDATNSCDVEGVSNDGKSLNVNSPGVSFGDGILDSVSMVDGVELHSENVLVECGSSALNSVVEGTNDRVLMGDGSEIRGSNVDGSLPGSSLGDGVIFENILVDSFLVDGSLVGNSVDKGNLSNFLLGDQDTVSVVSQSVSMGSEVSYEKSSRGRPKKVKRSGRPKKSNVIANSCVMEVNNNVQTLMSMQNNNETFNINEPLHIVNAPCNNNMNCVPEFLSIDLLDVPFGPMPNIANRIFSDDIVFSRPEINSLWSDPNMWLQDSFVFIYLKFLSYRSNLNVVVVSPQFAVVDYHFGQGVDPLNIFDYCYNYNQDYDILLIPIVFPGHFGLVIFDRSDRATFSCIFVDSLPSVNRLTDVSCGVFDQRRVDLIKRCICDLTPGLFVDSINIQVLPRSQFTEQRDGINCGFYYERKRILWHLSQLLLSNDIDYVGIFDYNPRNVQVNENVFNFNLDFGTDLDDNCVVNNFPVVNIEPDPPSENLRRSERIKLMQKNDVSELNISKISLKTLNEITSNCHRAHKLFPCADVRARHVVNYYDSGNLGDEDCYYCGAMLFKSEVNDAHFKKFKKTSSSYCCRCGLVVLPSFKPHPQLLRDLTMGDTQESLDFLKKQNIYNSLLAFASVFVAHRETKLDGGISYMLNGEFVRKLSSMISGDSGPSFSQLYILDADTAFKHRVSNIAYGGDRVNPDVLKRLDTLLRDCHPLANTYKNFHEQYLDKLSRDGPDSVENFRLVLLEEREAPELIKDNSLHVRQVNLPTEETLFSLHTESSEPPIIKGLFITNEEGKLFIFKPHHPQTDTLCYPLLFPCGDDSYHPKIPFARKVLNEDTSDNECSDCEDDPLLDTKRKTISIRDYVKYRLAVRKQEDYHNIWNSGGGLSQKFALDYTARIDSDVADYLRRDDLDLRASLPEPALRWLARDSNANSIADIGHCVMFRKEHPGTRPYFQDMFYDATTLMARSRKPENASFMFTFTSNPRWPEIKRNMLRDNQKSVDRFDIISRVYEDKLREIHYLLNKKHIFGKILGYAESREFQKRIGGPHLHRVFCTDIVATPDNISNLIWAHIPPEPPATDNSPWANFMRKVRELLPFYQFHDCGEHCKKANGKCKKDFPKPYSNITILHANKPAVYYRPSPDDGGETLKIKRGRAWITYDNTKVVPYNPLILVMFECHHNLEFAYGQTDNLKYALKYPFKGSSFSYVRSEVNGLITVDEPLHYARMIYRSPTEAYSRIMSFKYAFLSHIVIPLSIHLPDNQKIYFTSKNASKIISAINAGKIPDSRLSAYWKLCISDSAAKNILFENIPETYAFNKNDKVWKKLNISEKNKNRKPRIGRIYTVSPRDPELFALYILTKHFPGTPKDLLTVNGHECQTFAEAARLRGLFEDNNVWERTLREGSISLNPSQMRQLFANILVFGGTEKCVIDGLLLWNMFVDHFYDRRCTEAEKLIRIDRALAIIEKLLLSNGRSLQEFNLPLPNNSIRNNPDRALDEFFFPHHINDDEMDEAIDTSIYDNTNLNPEQQRFFNLIRASVLDPNTKNKLFFLSGDGGTGKTFLLNYIIYKLREMRLKVLATASTGIAATNFYAGGMTFHSAFRFGINVEPDVIPPVTVDSYFGRRIIEANLVIVDEVTILNKTIFENVNLLCKKLIPQYNNEPFAGKIVIISGDWKQSLPVVEESSAPGAQVAASIQSSELYGRFEKHRLMQNMRVIQSEIAFKDWLYSIGTGQMGDSVIIPEAMRVNSRQELYRFVFNTGFDAPVADLLKRLILSPTNRVVDVINSEIIDLINAPLHEYLSIDSPTSENPFAYNLADYEVAQLNRLTPKGCQRTI